MMTAMFGARIKRCSGFDRKLLLAMAMAMSI